MMQLLTIIHLFLIAGIAWAVWRKQVILRQYFWMALVIKLVSGVCLGLVYTYYYSVADTLEYFRDASILASLALRDFSSYVALLFYNTNLEMLGLAFEQPRAVFLTKITSVFCIVTGSNYWLIGFYYSLFSFLASWQLVRIIVRHIPGVRMAAVIAFLFVPSVVFWSSGVLKETLAIAALYFLTGLFLKIWFNERPTLWEYLLGLISLWVFWNLKYYYVAIFMPVVCTSLVFKFFVLKRFSLRAGKEALVWIGLLALPIIAVTFLHPNFYPARFLEVIVINNGGYLELSAPEDVVRLHELRPTPWSFLQNAPWALFSGLFRPLVWEATSVIQWLPAIENTMFLLLFLTGILRIRHWGMSPHRVLILTVVTYVVLLCVLITISAPNFGTLSRYRSGYFPFFVFIILCHHPMVQYLERSFPRLARD